MTTLQFADETRIVCFAYIKLQAVSDGGLETLVDMCQKELTKKTVQHGELVKDYFELVGSMLTSSHSNVEVCENEAENMSEDLKNTGMITQDRFNRAVKSVMTKNSAETIQDITSILHLLYLLAKKCGEAHLTGVVDLTVMSFMLCGQKIIQQRNGWLRLQEIDQDLSSSIVLVPEQVTTSAAHVASPTKPVSQPLSPVVISPQTSSPPTTPPFPISQDEGSESMDSATPPEIIDKPSNLTASLIQLMDPESSSKKPAEPDTPVNTPTEDEAVQHPPIDLAPLIISATEEETTEEVKQEEVEQEVKEEVEEEVKKEVEEEVKKEVMMESQVKDSQYDDTTSRPEKVVESSFSDYIPHISVGVVAAATCLGIFMMKK